MSAGSRGHRCAPRSPVERMTLTYARVSDRTIADEYFRVTEAVEDNYRTAQPLPAETTGRPVPTVGARSRS